MYEQTMAWPKLQEVMGPGQEIVQHITSVQRLIAVFTLHFFVLVNKAKLGLRDEI